MEKYITEKEVAEMLSCSVQSLRNWRSLGINLPYTKLGRRAVRYRLDDLIAFMEERRIEPKSNDPGQGGGEI